MHIDVENKELELLCIIVNFGLGSDILTFSKHHGVNGGTIFLGKGTIKNAFLKFLELTESRKEIVLMATQKNTANTVLEELNKHFNFVKPNHGIAFSTSISKLLESRFCFCQDNNENREVKNSMYNIITVVVDKGEAESVIDAATRAGSKGGTIINARGSGAHETSKLFSMEIEPEREIVLIISENQLTESIVTSIREQLKINEPGNGIIFVQDVNKVYGLH